MKYFNLGLIIFLLTFSLLSLFQLPQIYGQINDDQPIIPSSPTDVFIIEEAEYERGIGDDRPIVKFRGIVYWEQLGGSMLNFFVNTSDVIEDEFWDYESGKQFDISSSCVQRSGEQLISVGTDCVTVLSDRYLVVPGSRSFTYEILSYYDPDIIEDTGFIVIFNSQSVDFAIEVDGENVYAKVDYKNTVTLPVGAGIVSYAPIEDNGFPILNRLQTEEGVRFQLTWEYRHRQMDSKHDPLIIEVTYAFDDIYLKFTEQVYQNRVENERREEEQSKLDLLNTSFVVIATLALLASIFSILLAYLMARRKFENDLQKAKELPRRSVQDIEKAGSQKIPTKSLLLTGLILIPSLFSPLMIDAQLDNDSVIWKGEYILRTADQLTETVTITLPTERNELYVYTNVSEVNSIIVVDDQNNPLIFEPDPDGFRYKITNPTMTFKYIIDRHYKVYNYSQILIYLDRFWVEFFKPGNLQTIEEQYFRVDMTYTVILPVGAYLYSASPTPALDPNIEMMISTTNAGRWNITFTDENRLMDAFHDVFETQVTFSFVDILEALENLNTDFQVAKAKNQDIDSLLEVASSEILLFSLLGLIAPLISFFIAYWVFRNRYKKKIDEFEKKQEEQIFVEDAHIIALTLATEKDSKRFRESYIGHYWRLKMFVSNIVNKDTHIFSNSELITELKKLKPDLDEVSMLNLFTLGKDMEMIEEEINYGVLFEYAKEVDRMISFLEKMRY